MDGDEDGKEQASMENPSKMKEPIDPDSNSFNQADLLKALEVVERDSLAIADSYTSLFASLRLALSQVISTSVDHIRCFSDAAGNLQESAVDAAMRGNRFIHSCIRLNEEMKGIDGLASQLKVLRRMWMLWTQQSPDFSESDDLKWCHSSF